MAQPRWKQIMDGLVEKILDGTFAPGSQLPTSEAVALEHNVSRMTAHKALDELQRAGYVTRGGRRGTIVSSQTNTKKGRIAVIFDQIDFANSFPRLELLAGIQEQLGEDFNMVIADSKASTDREQELLEKMANESDGILWWSIGDRASEPKAQELLDKNYPLVLLDRTFPNLKVDSVISDSVHATREALEYLINKGHQRVGLLTFDKSQISTVAERCETFHSIMDEHGFDSPDLVRQFPAELEVKQREFLGQAFADAMFALINGKSPATAVFCVQDLLGVNAINYIGQEGIAIPEDFEIVTFNDWPPQWLNRPYVAHRIVVQPHDMGALAMQRLLAQINGTAGEFKEHFIPTQFIPADHFLPNPHDFQTQRPKAVKNNEKE